MELEMKKVQIATVSLAVFAGLSGAGLSGAALAGGGHNERQDAFIEVQQLKQQKAAEQEARLAALESKVSKITARQ
ncbi:MAG TPA: hypothetical protein DDW95_03125 [Alphaproteobacteria bacterium]|jgi:hypothetical protein|nr:hypothetical protein [Alphaproteobacteria bacterium]HAM47322.1 hypothetical protein [Alphaproteobacteria bacterium]HBA44076.1 hypothetical protein [Alphaproteobacteria bacterium]HBC52967.1 hypothetical protein [Alphaproteobacteria bacterium]HBF97518.1 hypothetical protein [Alphaproteobacteria bacterium]